MGRADPLVIGSSETQQADLRARMAVQERRNSVLGAPSSEVADATATVKGKLKLAGHLAGTADTPILATAAEPQIAKLGLGVAPTTALHFAASTSDTAGLQWGADSVPIRLYRSAANILRLDGVNETNGGFAINKPAAGAPASATAGFFFTPGGRLDQYRASVGDVLRAYAATDSQPKFSIATDSLGATLSWGTGSAVADVTLSRTAAGSVMVNSASASDVTVALGQGGTSLYQLLALGSNQKLRLQDGTRQYIRIDRTTGVLEFPFMAVDNGAAAGTISMAPGATWDVTAAPEGRFTFLKAHAPGFAGGANDRGGGVTDDVTASDAPNDPDSADWSWWQPELTSYSFASKGALAAHYIGVTQLPPTGATFPDSYNEVRCRDGFIQVKNKGGNSAIIESGSQIFNTTTTGAGPARARIQVCAMDDANLHSAYNDTGIFGTGSRYLHQGSIGLDFQAGGAGYVGTAVVFQGGGGSSETSAPSAYRRVIVLRNRAATMDLFCLDGAGNIGIRRSTNQVAGTTLTAALTLGWTSAGAESTVAADGILFGDDTTLYRGNADVLVTDDQFNALRHVISGTGGNGYIQYPMQSSDPAAPTDTNVRLFARRKTGDATKMELCVRFETSTHVLVAET